MKSEYKLVIVPREFANEDTVTLAAWLKKEGDRISEGDIICSLEFSKAVYDLPSLCSGWLSRLRKEGDEISVGEPIAAITDTPGRPEISQQAPDISGDIKITDKAKKLLDKYALDIKSFHGVEILRERDIIRHLSRNGMYSSSYAPGASDSNGKLEPLSSMQQNVARVLSESCRTIPHSYLIRWIDGAKADILAHRIAKRLDIMVSVSDLLVSAVARAALGCPKVNSSWTEKGIFYHSHVNVSFALNLPNGNLIMPVIKDANVLEMDQLIGKIRGLHKKILRHNFTPKDMTGGTIAVTSMADSGVHQVMPIIMLGQAVIVAISDSLKLFGKKTYCLTLAFDHRVLNGMEAALYLRKVAELMVKDG